jgi:hypothetical protein
LKAAASVLVSVALAEAFALVNTIESPVIGALPPQFAPVAKSRLPADPVQVFGAPCD